MKRLAERLSAAGESPSGKRLLGWLRRLFTVAILCLLVLELGRIGWQEIWRSRPTSPLFYLLFVVSYVQQPVFYAWAYSLSWRFPLFEGVAAIFKMCVYNNDVLGNSGEVYLFVWARERLGLPAVAVLRTIKDNAIVAWACDSVVSLSLPGLLVVLGLLPAAVVLGSAERSVALGAPVVVALVLTAAWLLRRHYLTLSDGRIAAVAAIYLARLGVIMAVVVFQWAAAMPEVPWTSWFALMAMRMLVNWIPILPNNDLMFLGAGVELSEVLGIPAAPLASMLLATSALSKLLNVAAFAALAGFEARPVPAASVPAPGLHSNSRVSPAEVRFPS